MNPVIALTVGEPAGIGPDLAILLAQQPRRQRIIAITDRELLRQRARRLQLPLEIHEVDALAAAGDSVPLQHTIPDSASISMTARETESLAEGDADLDAAGHLHVLHVPVEREVECARLDPANAAHVLRTLDIAIDGCLQGRFAAMVTAPLHKGVINDAGIAFTGHTEYLAERTGGTPVMMLATETANGPLRVALATTHLPLARVPEALDEQQLESTLRILHEDLQNRFGLTRPHILVAGLNPHAGEGGHMGREEIDIIEPVLRRLRQQGLHLSGPLPADTLFTPQHLNTADAVMAMFHDQGLPVLKYAGFGQAVNVTLGLPVIRTSVDHGTALDKAGSGNISSGSLHAALELAGRLIASGNKQ